MSSLRSHGQHADLAGLSQLHETPSVEEQRLLWRRGVATLAALAAANQPTPLEGLRPEGLLQGVRVALAAGLFDELGFLSRAEAAGALFELGAALPPGAERRALGRRILAAVHEGDGATFVTLAAALALASPRALAGAGVRARVALAMRLPLATGVNADALALALLARRELEREWLTVPSIGPLPARRLAARLVERAAREAVRRATDGDESGLRLFDRAAVRAAWTRLLADRESLVWRHVAGARGLLAGTVSELAAEIDRDLNPRLGPTEWRRAACSLAASLSHAPKVAAARCRELLVGELPRRDPGVAAAMIFGLHRAAEQEPDAADALLEELARAGGVDALEALAEFRSELGGGAVGLGAAGLAGSKLQGAATSPDDGLTALVAAVQEELVSSRHADEDLRARIDAALVGFAEGRDVQRLTDAALASADALMGRLEALGDGSAAERRAAFQALRELDIALLENGTLAELFAACGREPGAGFGDPLGEILGRLTSWILAHERQPEGGESVPHLTLRLRRIRALLHLLDAEGATGEEASKELRERRLATVRVLLLRVRGVPSPPLRRTVCAALARGCDALVRDEICELSDVFIAICWNVGLPEDLDVLSEASMIPEMKEMLHAAAEATRALATRAPGPAGERALLDAVRAIGEALPPGTSARAEGLRRALLGVARGLEAVAEAGGVRALREGTPTPIERVAEAVQYLAQLVAGAHRRMDAFADVEPPTCGRALHALDVAVAHGAKERAAELPHALAAANLAVRAELPALIAEIVVALLEVLPHLPADATREEAAYVPPRSHRLPTWLPPSRVVGGFYVVRPIGAGAGGSVFVARRVEHRHDDAAEAFALKVPSYNGTAAQTLSEDEFLQLFREEAGALISLPKHRNLAGFVTFDAGARPKPLLVMELVQGPTLERLLDKRGLSARLALAILEGVAAGLEGMHAAGVAHLDVKPANIILRYTNAPSISRVVRLDAAIPIPVLVDFGLAGRRLRPGCASPYYGAPEVWDPKNLEGATADPTAADVYAFCCLAYELFAGAPLFHGETLPALITAHLTHDGGPGALAALRAREPGATLAEILSAGLRRDPSRRATMAELREALAGISAELERMPWPAVA